MKSIYKPVMGWGASIEHVSGPVIDGPLAVQIAGQVCPAKPIGFGSVRGGHGMGMTHTDAGASFELDGLQLVVLGPFEAVARVKDCKSA